MLVICNYCGKRAKIVKGSALFPQYERLRDKLFWTCAPCKEHVGCHSGTSKSLGTLAKAGLRKLRHDCHLAFDSRWIRKRKRRNRTRKRAMSYIWLAGKLNIPVSQCHFGMFDEKTCEKALEVLKIMSKLQFSVLASGSKGNAVAVFPGTGPGFLLDCGLSKSVLKKRLELIGKSLADIQGTFITHRHGDHNNIAVARSLAWTRSVFTGIPGVLTDEPVNGCIVAPFRLSHGDCPCHGFRVGYKKMSFAYLVDTEYVPEESLPYLFDLDAIIIESNYREEMVIIYPGYGRPKERHLSNEQAACTLGLINSKRLKHVIMAHGSSRSNTPAFASNAGKEGAPQAEVLVAMYDRPTKMITLMN